MERGHTVARHLGGTEVRPEHKVCNREDGHKQTKIAAKIKRMQNKGFNVERAGKPKRLLEEAQVDRKRRRWWNSSRADKASKLKHDWRLNTKESDCE